jgi:FtsH-binding integral membrane protein
MDFLKTVTGKVISGLVSLAVIAAGISWWRMDEATKHTLLTNTGRIASWGGIVLLVPWATFFIVGWVAKFESNLAGGILVLVYTLLEALLLGWLFHWSIPGPTAWTFFAVGTLLAAVYNLLTCDWLAEKME